MNKFKTILFLNIFLVLLLCTGVMAQSSSGSDIVVSYSGHVQDVGDVGPVTDGEILGTTGESRRIEALSADLTGNRADVNIEYSAHVENIGWQTPVADGALAGTKGQALRIEALQLRLLGARADQYDIYYRVHAQDIGWMSWTSNGNTAGTTGYSRRLEALQIQVVPKGAPVTAGGPADDYAAPYISKPSGDVAAGPVSLDTPIMGNSGTTAAQLVNFYNTHSYVSYPQYYVDRGVGLDTFAQMYVDECAAEGVRVDLAFCQAMCETGFLGFGGDVDISQFNFAGLGATGGIPGENFAAQHGDNANGIRMGIRAQIQHLKAYGSIEPLNQPCVDTRFELVQRGVAPTLAGLSQRWAVGTTYAESILALMRGI